MAIPRKVEVWGREVEWLEVDFREQPKLEQAVVLITLVRVGGWSPRAPRKMLKGLFVGPENPN